jgi:hypothetical protein
VQIAKGLQTDGYTVPGKLKTTGDLEIGGKLKVGSNITISSDTNGDIINVGDRNKLTDGKTKINIGKYSLEPNKSGNDEILELKYTKDGNNTNNNTIARFSKDAGDKVQVCINDDCSKFLFINSEPTLGIYNNITGQNGFIGRARFDTIDTNKVNRLGTDETRIRLLGDETQLCAENDCNNKRLFVRYNEGNMRAGLYGNTDHTELDFFNNSDRKYKIKTWQKTFEIGDGDRGNIYNAKILYNNDGNVVGDSNKIFAVVGNDSHAWIQKEGGIGSFGKWASKGQCKNNLCNTRVKYCDKGGNPWECND